MTEQVSPASGLHGVATVPGDKSISHRYAMLASIANGDSKIYNYSTGDDCSSTLACMQAMGIGHEFGQEDNRRVLTIHGRGKARLQPPSTTLDAGNSGSTIRMFSGILAGQPFTTRIAGDDSLAKRPMRRIMAPLSQMGARIEAADGQFPPLVIQGAQLRAIDYALPVASAQVKSCVLFAGLFADGETVVREPITTRDHTEIALREFGAEVAIGRRVVHLQAGAELTGKTLVVPGDISSAAFFVVAALVIPGSDIILTGIGLNPTRTALLDLLTGMGAPIKVLHLEQVNGELIGNLQVRGSRIKGGVIEGSMTAAVIDEIPVLAILGALSEEGLIVRDAAELRLKETDRIETVARNLQRMGGVVTTTADGFEIPGRQKLHAAEIESCGDHRIAMAFSIAALAADSPCAIRGAEAVSVSFPEFFTTLRALAR